MEPFKDKLRQPVERQNVQPREAGKFFIREQLAFELKRRLFGRENDQRVARGIIGQRRPHFGETAESFSAAGGPEQEARLHGASFHAKPQGRKGIYRSPGKIISRAAAMR